jgi:hypothetical protein
MALLGLLAGPLFSEEGQRPACTRESRGTIWPGAQERTPCTEVAVCTVKRMHFAWVPVTVHVSRLSKVPGTPSVCDVPAAPQAQPQSQAPAPQETASASPAH